MLGMLEKEEKKMANVNVDDDGGGTTEKGRITGELSRLRGRDTMRSLTRRWQ